MAGITEIRAGVYVFFDLVMAELGLCSIDEIAISVLATVIGRQDEKGWAITDAGWMALSQDRGIASPKNDFGYGFIQDIDGSILQNLYVKSANQEHGIIAARPNQAQPILSVGDMVRILPNHACSTASQFDEYILISEQSVTDRWRRINGWR